MKLAVLFDDQQAMLEGDVEGLTALAQLLRTGAGRIATTDPCDIAPFELVASAVECSSSSSARVVISVSADALRFEGPPHLLEVCAANIDALVANQWHHIHEEYYPDHPVVAPDSHPLVVCAARRMQGITIRDVDPQNALAFDLRDILEVLGTDAIQSTWTVSGVECVGPAAAELHAASDDSRPLTGSALVDIARRVDQVIDGKLEGRFRLDRDPWVIIRAVDSSCYDVITVRPAVLHAFRAQFRDVTDLAEDEI